jgi:two-component system response regulator PilR (NtrC family)
VRLCHHGDKALEILSRETFDLVLSDIMLPGASGLTILHQTCGDPCRTLVILMTGFSGIEDVLDAVEQGAHDFVSKPFQLPEIRVRLDNASRYQQLMRKLMNEDVETSSQHKRISDSAAVRVYGAQKKLD